ncbi:MAG TPA: hypothetical protein VMB51_16425 [Solirubrobacteraceae bacterium]|nr:hypothetical protein [Solirubrobacteraceae bacterium]
MRRLTLVGFCAAVALIGAGFAAASALAFKEEAPEIGRCLKLTGGRFKEGNCKTAAKGAKEEKYEWYPAFGPNAKGEEQVIEPAQRFYTAAWKEGTAIRLETVNGEGVVCKTQTSEGEYTGPKTNRNYNIVFTGCEASGVTCISTNPKAANHGEIRVKELDGTIGIEKLGATSAKDKLANVLKPMEGEVLTEFECSGLKFVVKGEVMEPIKTNTMLTAQTIKFTATKGKQKPEKFATDPAGTKRVLFTKNSKLEEFFQSGQTLTTIQTNLVKGEASAVN